MFFFFKSVLKSLKSHRSEKSVRRQIKILIDDAEALLDRNLNEEAARKLQRAKKMAWEIEDLHFVVYILTHQKTMMGRHVYRNFEQNIQTLLEEEKQALAVLENQNELNQIYYRIFNYLRTEPIIRDAEELQTIKLLVRQTPVLQSEENAMCATSKILFSGSLFFFHHLIGDFQLAFKHGKRMIEHWQLRPKLIEVDKSKYLASISNVMNCAMLTRQLQEIVPLLELMRNMKADNRDMEVQLFSYIHQYELVYRANSGQLESLQELLLQVENGIEKYGSEIQKSMLWIFYYNLTNLYLLEENYDKALHWNLCLLNDEYREYRKDMFRTAKIINLILHFELDNTDSMGYYVTSTYRFLSKQKQLYKFEKMLLKFLKRSSQFVNTLMLKDEFKAFHAQCIELEKDPNEKGAFAYFDYPTWLNSKITGRSFKELFLEKIAANVET